MPTAAEIKSNVDSIISKYRLNREAFLLETSGKTSKPVNPLYDKEPPKNIRGFKQGSTDTTGDSTLTARDIGSVTEGKTRLNVVSALTDKDNVDFFKFTATANQKLGIAITTDKGVRVQILDSKGRVIGDSEAKFGDKFENFQKAGAQNLDITKGVYFIKVTRETGALNTVKPNYAVQVSTTKYYESDYDTTETPAPKQTFSSSYAQSGAGLNELLNQVYGGLFDSANGTYYNKEV